MTLVVADTGPIRYLVCIHAADVRPQLFDRIIIPATVLKELIHAHAPEPVRTWATSCPSWIEVKQAQPIVLDAFLGPGETDAIALGKELKADYILLDDGDARAEALRQGSNRRCSSPAGKVPQFLKPPRARMNFFPKISEYLKMCPSSRPLKRG